MNDIIHTTSVALCVPPKQIFRDAAEEMRFSNHIEVADHRHRLWFIRGEIPPYVESHCKRQLERATNIVRLYENKATRVDHFGDEHPLFI